MSDFKTWLSEKFRRLSEMTKSKVHVVDTMLVCITSNQLPRFYVLLRRYILCTVVSVSLLQKRPYSSHTTDSESSSGLKDVKLDTSTFKRTVVKPKNTKKSEVQKGKQQNLRSFFMPTLAMVKDKDNNQCFDQCAEESTFKSLINNIHVDASLGNLSNSVGGEHQPLEYQDIGAHKGFLDVETNKSSQISSGEISQHLNSQEKDDWPPDASSLSPLSVEPETGKIGLESCTLDLSQKSTATMEWQRIQKAMLKKVPLCKGHKEPCVVRVVKKPGLNFGRAFHVCARAQVLTPSPHPPEELRMLFSLVSEGHI